MIIKLITIIFLVILIFSGCRMNENEIDTAELKNEIVKMEKEFAELVKTGGIKKAFLYYAAEDAVLNRNNTLIRGKEEIKTYFENQTLSDIKLEWKPDFVDVAESGDIAYTYGKYNFSAKSETGEEVKSTGVFHTVWKKQDDGSWKYVWD